MLLDRVLSCLILVDVQEKLAPLVRRSKQLLSRCEWLIRLSKELSVPLLACEQYPQGLGKTIAPLNALISPEQRIEKIHFSCFKNAVFKHALEMTQKKQIILMGIETHVCVLQSAMHLLDAGYDVFVVVDATSSRFEHDHECGLDRMKQAGAQWVTSEMVFFEWIGQAGTKEFKALSKTFLM